jgi:hypothetical protein
MRVILTKRLRYPPRSLAGQSLTYDANGNQLTDEAGDVLVYDAWDRNVGWYNPDTSGYIDEVYVFDENGNPTVSNPYDALGRRVSRRWTTSDFVVEPPAPRSANEVSDAVVYRWIRRSWCVREVPIFDPSRLPSRSGEADFAGPDGRWLSGPAPFLKRRRGHGAQRTPQMGGVFECWDR